MNLLGLPKQIHRLDGFNNRNSLTHSFRSRESKIQEFAGLTSSEASIPLDCKWPPPATCSRGLRVPMWPNCHYL